MSYYNENDPENLDLGNIKLKMDEGNDDYNEEYENTNKDVEFREEPIQLIKFDNDGFKLNEEALNVISSIEDDIVVVAVIGKARTGKSYLMNLLLDLVGKGKGVRKKK